MRNYYKIKTGDKGHFTGWDVSISNSTNAVLVKDDEDIRYKLNPNNWNADGTLNTNKILKERQQDALNTLDKLAETKRKELLPKSAHKLTEYANNILFSVMMELCEILIIENKKTRTDKINKLNDFFYKALEKQAVAEGWSCDELTAHIKTEASKKYIENAQKINTPKNEAAAKIKNAKTPAKINSALSSTSWIE